MFIQFNSIYLHHQTNKQMSNQNIKKMETAKINTVEEIQLEGLEQLITEKIGIPIKFKKEIRTRRDDDSCYIVLESQELKMFAGILSTQYKSLKICNFGGSLASNELGYWLPLHFSFSYINGGSNGNTICDAYYEFETNTWKIFER